MQKVLPADVSGVIVEPQNTPRRPRLFLAMALMRPSVDEPQLGFRAPIDERPSLVRIAQQRMDAMPARQAPEDVPPQGLRADLRQRQLCRTIPEHGLTSTAQCMKLLEDAGAGVLPLAVGALFDPIITGAYKPHGDVPHDMAPLDFGFTGLAGALTHEAQLIFGHGAFHPEDSPIIELARSIDAILLEEQRLGPRTQIDQMMPVAIVASQP
jgi:hypothetical protein